MGSSIGGIAIKTTPEKFQPSSIFKDLISENFQEFNENEVGGRYSFDNRSETDFSIYKDQNTVWIINSYLCEQFFNPDNLDIFNKYYKYFDNSEFIFAFQEYDSSGVYGYSVIKNGILKRIRKSVVSEIEIDLGQPEDVEMDWLTAETHLEEYEPGSFNKIYYNKKQNDESSEYQLTATMMNELLFNNFGVITWDIEFKALSRSYFKIM